MKDRSEIKFTIHLDENRVPEHIEWEADDKDGKSNCHAALLALWDEKEQTTLRIDLWTKQMNVDHMKHFFFQNILTMADTFERATGETKMAEEMRQFGKDFGEKMLSNKQ